MQENQKKILLIEDDVSICKLYKITFEADGYLFEDAQNGKVGLGMAQNNKYDLILLDLMLPGMNGFDILRVLKGSEDTKNIPVIVLTNLAGNDALKAKNLGALECLLKASLTPDEVVEKIKEIAFS